MRGAVDRPLQDAVPASTGSTTCGWLPRRLGSTRGAAGGGHKPEASSRLGAWIGPAEKTAPNRTGGDKPPTTCEMKRMDPTLLGVGRWTATGLVLTLHLTVERNWRAIRGASGCSQRWRGSHKPPGWRWAGRKPRRWTGAATDFDSAGARASRQIRRYCAENRLVNLWTLTYAGEGVRDYHLVRRHVWEFFRRLRGVVGKRFAYLWTTEWHPGGHGLHVHFAVGEYIAHWPSLAVWGHGLIVNVRGPREKLYGQRARERSRSVGRYIAKYVSKAPAAPIGYHRYEVAQGFKPAERRLAAADLDAAYELACAGDGRRTGNGVGLRGTG